MAKDELAESFPNSPLSRPLLADVSGLLDQTRRGTVRAVNAIMTATYWEIGRRKFEQEQREHCTLPDENPPVGLILCSEQDASVAHCALEGLRNAVLTREYRLALPEEGRLADQIQGSRQRLLERCGI